MKRSLFTAAFFILVYCQIVFAQGVTNPEPAANLRSIIGERLTYNVSFSNFSNAAYAETYVVSEGKHGDRNAIYLQGKIKTTEMFSAAFSQIDENRRTLIDEATGLPILYKQIFDETGIPRESVTDFKGEATAFDWLSALFQFRFTATHAGGTLQIREKDSTFPASYRLVGKAYNKTTAGEFNTTVYEITNPTFPGLQIHLSDDSKRIPVAFSFKMARSVVRGQLASIQNVTEPAVVVTPTPQANPTPRPAVTPTPRPTPQPYKNNEPLNSEFPFQLGETLTYRLSKTGSNASFGTMTVQAKERRQFAGPDNLLLALDFSDVTDSTAPFRAGDRIRSYVDPEALLPQRTELVFSGAMVGASQSQSFNQQSGKASTTKGISTDIPVGTHDILSLAYAIRSFNVRNVKPSAAPGADIRVALFYGNAPVVLTILSQPEEMVDFQGQKVTSQIVFASVGDTTVKLWLSKDPARLPLRLSFTGPALSFTADLVTVIQNPPPADSTAGAPMPGIPGAFDPTTTNAPAPRFIPGGPNDPARIPQPNPGANPTLVNPKPDQPNPSLMPLPSNTTNPTLTMPVPSGPNPTLVNPTPNPNIKRP